MAWMKRVGWTLAGVALLAAVSVGVYRQRVLPVTAGNLSVAGAKAPVRIERDAQGIPTIRAASAEDAWFGLGFVHAQDRLWQMETHRRIGAGRLAEAFGPSAVDTDRFLRALAVRRAAATQWARLDGEARAAMLSYAAGVNAFLKDHLRARPPEFLVLGLQPEQWDTRGQPVVEPDDGLGPGRQLDQRDDALAPERRVGCRPDQRSLAALSR